MGWYKKQLPPSGEVSLTVKKESARVRGLVHVWVVDTKGYKHLYRRCGSVPSAWHSVRRICRGEVEMYNPAELESITIKEDTYKTVLTRTGIWRLGHNV